MHVIDVIDWLEAIAPVIAVRGNGDAPDPWNKLRPGVPDDPRVHESTVLRYEGFKPEAGGVRTILPHIGDFRPVHNIASLMDIAAALSAPPPTEAGTAWG